MENFFNWVSRVAFVGIGIGERAFWGKGYGTDAMRLLLKYGFTELDQRALRAYEKTGFQLEGRQRQGIQREGRRWDILYMGILREEWMENYGYNIFYK